MKATFSIILNKEHRNALHKTELWFKDVDISVIPSVGWTYQYKDNGESYYGKISKLKYSKTLQKMRKFFI